MFEETSIEKKTLRGIEKFILFAGDEVVFIGKPRRETQKMTTSRKTKFSNDERTLKTNTIASPEVFFISRERASGGALSYTCVLT